MARYPVRLFYAGGAMNIEYHRPAARGVATLMYVGDDQAVERSVSAPGSLEMGVAIAGAALALLGSGPVRTAGGVVALAVIIRHAVNR